MLYPSILACDILCYLETRWDACVNMISQFKLNKCNKLSKWTILFPLAEYFSALQNGSGPPKYNPTFSFLLFPLSSLDLEKNILQTYLNYEPPIMFCYLHETKMTYLIQTRAFRYEYTGYSLNSLNLKNERKGSLVVSMNTWQLGIVKPLLCIEPDRSELWNDLEI